MKRFTLVRRLSLTRVGVKVNLVIPMRQGIFANLIEGLCFRQRPFGRRNCSIEVVGMYLRPSEEHERRMFQLSVRIDGKVDFIKETRYLFNRLVPKITN